MTSLSAGVAVTSVVSVGWLSAAHAASGFVGGINDARSSHGLPAYALAGDLQSMATAQATRMAAKLAIFHNPNLAAQGGSWRSLGENVGVGGDPSSLTAAFLASPEHRANILSRTFTQVAVGTATGSDGRLYVDEVFRLPVGAAQPTPQPSPTTSASPTPIRPSNSRSGSAPTASSSSASGSSASGSSTTRTSPASGQTTGLPTSRPPTKGLQTNGLPTTARPTAQPAGGTFEANRANRFEQRRALTVLPVLPRSFLRLSAAQLQQLAGTGVGRSSGSAADDPISRSLRWWRGMQALTR